MICASSVYGLFFMFLVLDKILLGASIYFSKGDVKTIMLTGIAFSVIFLIDFALLLKAFQGVCT